MAHLVTLISPGDVEQVDGVKRVLRPREERLLPDVRRYRRRVQHFFKGGAGNQIQSPLCVSVIQMEFLFQDSHLVEHVVALARQFAVTRLICLRHMLGTPAVGREELIYLLVQRLVEQNHLAVFLYLMQRTPLILVGRMWADLVDWAKSHLLTTQPPLANPEDLDLPVCVDKADQAIALLQERHAEWTLQQRASGPGDGGSATVPGGTK